MLQIYNFRLKNDIKRKFFFVPGPFFLLYIIRTCEKNRKFARIFYITIIMYTSKYTLRTLIFVLATMALTTLGSCKKDAAEQVENGTTAKASKHRQRDEQRAAEYLVQARNRMQQGQYDAARDLIKQMRDTCYLAYDAREQGILLLDSIELLSAMADTTAEDHDTRVKFYQKKLEYDLQAGTKAQNDNPEKR